MEPETRYARSGGIAIAYQVVGSGALDLVYVPDYMSNLGYVWGYARWSDFYLRLAHSFRLILFDKRGTGLSDHGGRFAALETRTEDLHSVLDAAGSDKAVILGSHEGCGMAALFAATYPERTRALVLFHPAVRGGDDDHGDASEAKLRELQDLRDRWGSQEFADEILRESCQTLYASEEDRREFAALPADRRQPGRRLRAQPCVRRNRPERRAPRGPRPGARPVPELRARGGARGGGADPGCPGDPGERRGLPGDPPVTGGRRRDRAVRSGGLPPAVPERVLATLMFTDIVGSTERAAALGDAGWRELLARHHTIVRRELSRFHGVEHDTAGDGSSRSFDGPARAIRCAQAIIPALAPIGVQVRVGIHVGECELHDGKPAGLAVASGRGSARPGARMTCSCRRPCATSSREPASTLADHGSHSLKGVPGERQLYAVVEPESAVSA